MKLMRGLIEKQHPSIISITIVTIVTLAIIIILAVIVIVSGCLSDGQHLLHHLVVILPVPIPIPVPTLGMGVVGVTLLTVPRMGGRRVAAIHTKLFIDAIIMAIMTIVFTHMSTVWTIILQ